jgi:hypothetical protein
MLRFEMQHPAASEVELWAGRADRDADLPSSSGRDPVIEAWRPALWTVTF